MNKEPPVDPKFYPQGKDYFHPERKTQKNRVIPPTAIRWVLSIVGWTFVLSLALSFLSDRAAKGMGIFPAVLVLLFFIALGISFDVIGIAVATADEKPFHSMSARRVPGAYQSLRLLRNADKVSSICNDVVGDVSGIISGATITVIVTNLVNGFSAPELVTHLLFSAVVSSLTVGGKALGKTAAMKNNTKIVHIVGRAMFLFLRAKRKIRELVGRG